MHYPESTPLPTKYNFWQDDESRVQVHDDPLYTEIEEQDEEFAEYSDEKLKLSIVCQTSVYQVQFKARRVCFSS